MKDMTERDKDFLRCLKVELKRIRKENKSFPKKQKDLLVLIKRYKTNERQKH